MVFEQLLMLKISNDGASRISGFKFCGQCTWIPGRNSDFST